MVAERTQKDGKRQWSLRKRLAGLVVLACMLPAVVWTLMGTAAVNVLVRREIAYAMEERLSSLGLEARYVTGGQVEQRKQWPEWISPAGYEGLVFNSTTVTYITARPGTRDGTAVPLTAGVLKRVAAQAGIKLLDTAAEPVVTYRQQQNTLRSFVNNFVPGSGQPVPVVLAAREWATGKAVNIVVCRVAPGYEHTLRELRQMGLQPVVWLGPPLALVAGLLLVCALCMRWFILVARHIGNVVVSAGEAAEHLGRGDLHTRLQPSDCVELARLGGAFNAMADNLQTLMEARAATQRLESDVALGSEVQTYLTPSRSASLREVTAWSTSTPARKVSGDLHECLVLGPNSMALMCADVSGKGVASAMVMAYLQGLLQSHLYPGGPAALKRTPSEVVALLNEELHRRFEQTRYATLFYAEVDVCRRKLTYVNAGHCCPVLLTGGKPPALLTSTNLPAGLFAGVQYEEATIAFAPGDKLLVYTDGVLEATNKQGCEYGEQRLMAALQSARAMSARETGLQLRQKLEIWTAGVEQADDATFLVAAFDA